MSSPHHASIPAWAWAVPLLASALAALKVFHIVPADDTCVLILAGLFLAATVFAAVHHAEVLALKLGEPFGSILLAVAVTVIEAGLIVSIMLAGAEGSERVARDTVFAAVMIVLNGVVGLCLVLGAGKHFEQTFQLQGAASALAVLGTLATLALILPNFAEAAAGPSYSILQLEGIGLMSLVLWCVFVFVQTIKHRDYFLDAPSDDDSGGALNNAPSVLITLLSFVLLVVSLAAVVLLAKTLSYPVDAAIRAAGFAEGLRRRRHCAHRAHARGARRDKIGPSQSAAEQHQSRAGLRYRQHRADNSDGGAGLDRAQPPNRAGRFANRHDFAHSDPLYLCPDPRHRAHDCAAGRRASRYIRGVHAGLGRAVVRVGRRCLSFR
jgi:hypothetical protein